MFEYGFVAPDQLYRLWGKWRWFTVPWCNFHGIHIGWPRCAHLYPEEYGLGYVQTAFWSACNNLTNSGGQNFFRQRSGDRLLLEKMLSWSKSTELYIIVEVMNTFSNRADLLTNTRSSLIRVESRKLLHFNISFLDHRNEWRYRLDKRLLILSKISGLDWIISDV